MNGTPTEVIKFGGSLMANAESMLDSARFVKAASENARVAVIVSASQGTTNALVEIADTVNRYESETARSHTLDLHNKHIQLVRDLGLSSWQEAYLSDIIYGATEQLYIYADSATINPAMRDYMLSLGEYVSAYIFTEALQKIGLEHAEQIDAYQLIRTDSNFGEAKPNLPQTVENIQSIVVPRLLEGKTIVTPGYYGVNQEGMTTTLGRNASDCSAALLAYGLHADRLILCKGVPGVFDKDPSVHADARLFEELTYEQATEMALNGGKVIHHETMGLVREKNIPIHVMDPRTPEMFTRIGRGKEAA